MKSKIIKELHGKSIDELKALAQSVKEELASLVLEKHQGKLKNISSLFHKRKDMARIKTILNEKEQIV